MLHNTIAFLEKTQTKRKFIVQYKRFYEKIRQYILSRVGGDVMVCEDLTSNIFIKAFEKFDSYDDEYAFSTWVYTIAKNTLTDHYRASSRSQTTSLDDAMNVSDDEKEFYEILDLKIDIVAVKKALQLLPASQADVINRRYFLAQEISEIAQDIDKNEAAIRQILSRGCRKLKALLVDS